MKITRVLNFKIVLIALLVVGTLAFAAAPASARVFVSVGFAPPLIPVYEQPLAPAYGYIWTPGYWAYGDNGYYWVDGAWVDPPYVGALWTPGYWGYGGDAYLWHAGYWGRNIGYYGGINYGFGYFGTGFYGGYWNGGRFFYNGAYNHIGFHEGVYNQRVNGFDGRPGGAAFASRNAGFNGREANSVNRGSSLNGNSFANRGSFAANSQARTGANGAVRPASSFGQSRGSYAAPQSRSYSGGGNVGGRASSGGNAGGGFHGGGGGGGRGGGHR
jgi:uncharacterized membrane protein YgcG